MLPSWAVAHHPPEWYTREEICLQKRSSSRRPPFPNAFCCWFGSATVYGKFHFPGRSHPCPLPIPGADFPIVQYADDTLLIMQACPIQLLRLKSLLQEFAAATGLRVNYAKSCILPINVSDDKMRQLAATFECSIGTLPFTYLGLPLGTARPTVRDLAPVSDQIERRLNACARFLPHGGRLMLVNSVMSALATYLMCSLKLNKTFLKSVNRARRHCLWDKREDSTSFAGLAAWDMVCKPKEKGGLGIINLELQNNALLLKQLHKFFERKDIPWVQLVWSLYSDAPPQAQSRRGSFWWRDIFDLADTYRSITACKVGDGHTALFWKDFWIDDTILAERFPRLFSFVENPDASVNRVLTCEEQHTLYSVPMSVEAFEEYQDLQQLCTDNVAISQELDSRSFVWGKTNYTSADYYRYMFDCVPKDEVLAKLWKSRCLPKLKVFCWLLINDRLNTKDMMLRKHWHVDGGSECVLCQRSFLEDRDHLFFSCDFATACWDSIGITWNMNNSPRDRISEAAASFSHPNFLEFFASAAWNIWKERNDLIFNGVVPSFQSWRMRAKQDLLLHQFRVKPSKVQPLLDRITTFF